MNNDTARPERHVPVAIGFLEHIEAILEADISVVPNRAYGGDRAKRRLDGECLTNRANPSDTSFSAVGR